MKRLPLLLGGLFAFIGAVALRHITTAQKLAPGAQLPAFLRPTPVAAGTPATPTLTPVPTIDARFLKLQIQAEVSGFEPAFRRGYEDELELVMRSDQCRFARIKVNARDSKTNYSAKNLPLRLRASGGEFQEAIFSRDDKGNKRMERVQTNSYGFAIAD